MRFERVAVVWDYAAVPWAPIMLGIVAGLRAAGVQVMEAPAAPDWLTAEQVRRFDPHVVLVGLHDALRQHVPAWRTTVGGARAWVALCFDDPYDMATTLDLAPQFDLLLTPEPCAVDLYERRGWRADVLAPTVCDRWHRPAAAAVAVAHDVLHVGGNHWTPRRQWLPHLVAALRQVGRVFSEAAGKRRWLVGPDLTRELHRSRLTIDVPRQEWFTTNPHQVPCTYTGPRVHIAAACGVLCLCINPRGDLANVYPSMPSAELGDGIAMALQLLDDDAGRQERAGLALERFREAHAPAVRGRELLALLQRHCLGDRVSVGSGP